MHNLNVVRGPAEAMTYLRRQVPYADAAGPDLILLDLNLLKKDGREVLAEGKNDYDLKRSPVVVLSASDAGSDILRSYDLHAGCYITKPVDMQQFIKLVKSIKDFWPADIKLPTE